MSSDGPLHPSEFLLRIKPVASVCSRTPHSIPGFACACYSVDSFYQRGNIVDSQKRCCSFCVLVCCGLSPAITHVLNSSWHYELTQYRTQDSMDDCSALCAVLKLYLDTNTYLILYCLSTASLPVFHFFPQGSSTRFASAR